MRIKYDKTLDGQSLSNDERHVLYPVSIFWGSNAVVKFGVSISAPGYALLYKTFLWSSNSRNSLKG